MFMAFHLTRQYLFAAMIALALLGIGLGTLFSS